MKKIIVAIVGVMMIFAFAGCGGGSDTDNGGEKVYVDEANIDNIFIEPTAYEGQYVKLAGKVTEVERKGDIIAVQAVHDLANYNEDFVAYAQTDENFRENDIIIVDGMIGGSLGGGQTFDSMYAKTQITADSIEKSTYAEAIDPPIETREINKEQTQADATMTVTKVEFAKNETRIFVELKNDSDYTVTAYTSSARVVQDGKEIESEYNYEANYPEIDEVSAHASKDGVICVAPLDPEKEMTLYIDAYTENWDADMEDFEFTF